MSIYATVLSVLVALEFFYIMYLETFATASASTARVFGTDDLQLEKRVVYIHGVPQSLKIPDTVGGKLTEVYDQYVTLPIAAGKIKKVTY